MAVGRTFKEALQKAIRSLEIGCFGLGGNGQREALAGAIREKLALPSAERIFYLNNALKMGISPVEIAELTKIDRWFLENMKQIVDLEEKLKSYRRAGRPTPALPADLMRQRIRLFRCVLG